ncbi:hypothetical protein [Polyangium mundeleinium]|uniref:Quinohemoprotein amine dehydrogenase alpha subunit domain-containing protein n=1 Tax=Polyangium mundeleinium TaxID=2995306 RepID=A0ABT5F6H8_9BACT|nr:hypothetical protein [Polyangium mundeleinium]MDC0749062.1 hypothetical protein [Polyangium mundeleinium]
MRMSRVGLLSLSLVTLFALGCSGDAGPQGPAGQPGEEGPSADPSISAVTPGKVFISRRADITISGFNTTWTDAASLDFGPGVTVVDKKIASPTAIVATIEIDASAAIGPRDVNVSEGESKVTYAGAFSLDAPLEVSFLGTQAQGSILIASAKQRDLSTPFDLTTTGDGFFEPLVYTNLAVSSAGGVFGDVADAQLYAAELTVFTDVTAAAGPADVTIASGLPGEEILSPAPGSLQIAARQPTALTPGMNLNGTIDQPFATVLYQYTPTGPGKIIAVEALADSPDASPGFAVLPASGKFTDLITFEEAPTVEVGADPIYFIYWDNTGTSGYGFDLSITEIVPAEVEPNNTCGEAQAVASLPASLDAFKMADKDDQDWLVIDAVEADVGKVIHVVTSAGEAQTDTVVEVVGSDCTTSLGVSEDSNYHEDFTSDPIPAPGKYYIKVTNSTYGYSGALYNLEITLE